MSVDPPIRPRFQNRTDAGRVLAADLARYEGRADLIVLALPRGGVPVGHEVARALGAPLGVFVVRKLGVPGREELAMGAIATGGVVLLDERLVGRLGLQPEEIQRTLAAEARELERRQAAYTAGSPPLEVEGKTVILVDDGLATGASMRAAAIAVRRLNPARVVIAVPVASPEACEELRSVVD